MRNWQTCEDDRFQTGSMTSQLPMARLSRRSVLGGVAMGLLGWMSRRTALAQVTLNPKSHNPNVLVVVFLRGGADGLSLLVPHGDDAYFRLRPTLSVPKKKIHDLDGFFGLHPSMMPLLPIYESGQLAALHAVGSDDQTRSHFEAMNTMERGVARRDGPQSGWVARYLDAVERQDPSPMRAVAIGHTTPTSLVGAADATTLESLADFKINASLTARHSLQKLYGEANDPISVAGQQTFDVLRTLERIDAVNYRPENAASYPKTDLGEGLRKVACLIRGDVGLEMACLDRGGWDSHVAQGTESGWLPIQMDDLSHCLAAFAQDMGHEMSRTTVIVMTEFGRRIAENAGLGTDHGHGSAMFTFGGGVKGGRVYAKWPGLDKPVGPGDLDVTTDYRDVLAEALRTRMGLSDPGQVFAGHPGKLLGIFG